MKQSGFNGGVGQSLFSLHLDSMLGHNHGFFDPNVWFNEDELRKQVETYARCNRHDWSGGAGVAQKASLGSFQKDSVRRWHCWPQALRIYYEDVPDSGLEVPGRATTPAARISKSSLAVLQRLLAFAHQGFTVVAVVVGYRTEQSGATPGVPCTSKGEEFDQGDGIRLRSTR